MPPHRRHQHRFKASALASAVLSLGLLSAPIASAHAQITPVDQEVAATAPDREIAVAPEARDTAIADRLDRILTASGWFDPLEVSVREGIVFLDGKTETDERKKWAEQLILRTQDVVAVVNRLEVERTVSWNLSPTWREVERLVDNLRWFAPLALVSLLILAVFLLFARSFSRFSQRALRRRMSSNLLADLSAKAIALPIILIGIYLVLQVAGLTQLALTVLGGTGLIGIVIGLAFREIAENALASALLSARNPFRTGDWIAIGEYEGIVQNLNMRSTILLTLDGNHIQIPNSKVFKSVIINYSSNPNRRAEFAVGIGYDDSVVKAQEIIIKTLKEHPAVLEDPEPAAIVNELGQATVNLRAQFWFDGRVYSVFKLRSSLIRQVKRALQDAEISMPDAAREIIFPQGVPLRGGDIGSLATTGPNAETQRKQTRPTSVDRAESANVSKGEGNLKSEEAELQRQAKSAGLPEAGDNLLSGSKNDPIQP